MKAAARSQWVLTTDELRELGLTANQITARTGTGLSHRRYVGVYAVGRPTLDFEGECLAAVRACGPGTAIVYVTAAGLWGIRPRRHVFHVAAPRSRTPQRGLILHRPRSLPLDAVTEHRGVPVTTLARTLLDLAGGLTQRQVGWAMHEAAVQKLFDPTAVLMELERNPWHRGRKRLGQLLESEVAPTRSGLEIAALEICRGLALPEPETTQIVRTDRDEEADVCWRSLRLIVEWDGGRYHSTRWRRRMDAEKTARLQAAGWVVLRFSDLDVALEPARVGERIVRAARSGLPDSPLA